jgi:hypothetical protein
MAPVHAMSLIAVCFILFVSLFIIVLPVQWAARAMGAKRSGFWWCLTALVGASILHGLGLALGGPAFGSVAAFFLAALGFAAILDTGYVQGIGIALLHIIFSVLILLLLFAVFGLSLAGIMAGV